MARVNEGLHSFTCHPHVYPQVEGPAFYSPAAENHRTLADTHFRPAEDRRLSWPEWLVTNRGGLPARWLSPIPVLTGPGVE